jgi:uncharacterized membrane protein
MGFPRGLLISYRFIFVSTIVAYIVVWMVRQRSLRMKKQFLPMLIATLLGGSMIPTLARALPGSNSV